ncbi:MAG: HNH endonuclease [Patescibacteria group bacterium]
MSNIFFKKKVDQNWNAYETQRRHTLLRDGKRCTICNSKSDLTVHHIVHRSKGGTNNNINLITVCQTCHRKIHGDLRDIVISGTNPTKFRSLFVEKIAA